MHIFKKVKLDRVIINSFQFTFHEPGEGFRAGGGDRQGQFVHCNAVGDRQAVDSAVRHLPCQQLPQQHTVPGHQVMEEAGGR